MKQLGGFSALHRKNVNKKQVSEESEKTEEAFDNKKLPIAADSE